MKRRNLTPTELQDAERLSRQYQNWKIAEKEAGRPATQEAIASVLNMSQSAFSQYCRGVIPLNKEILVSICAKLGWKVEDISPSIAAEISKLAEESGLTNEVSDHAPILMVDAKASAGRGSVVFSDDTSKTLMFRRDWLAKKGAKPDSVLAFTVDGDSMADAHIPEGSIVLANKCPEEPISGRIYVVWIGDQLFVKKLHKENDTWVARSCNKKKNYPDIPINTDSGLVGQVFWCGFEL